MPATAVKSREDRISVLRDHVRAVVDAAEEFDTARKRLESAASELSSLDLEPPSRYDELPQTLSVESKGDIQDRAQVIVQDVSTESDLGMGETALVAEQARELRDIVEFLIDRHERNAS